MTLTLCEIVISNKIWENIMILLIKALLCDQICYPIDQPNNIFIPYYVSKLHFSILYCWPNSILGLQFDTPAWRQIFSMNSWYTIKFDLRCCLFHIIFWKIVYFTLLVLVRNMYINLLNRKLDNVVHLSVAVGLKNTIIWFLLSRLIAG